jgi:outer membrane protein OmpA-like peptidoglycan-associated protein
MMVVAGVVAQATPSAFVDLLPSFAPVRYPAVSTDGKTLVLIADEESGAKCYIATHDNLSWSTLEPFEYFNNLMQESGAEVGGFSFNHDNTQIYFHARIGSQHYGIYTTSQRNGKWEAPQKMELPFGADADLYSPSISSDNKTLFVLVKEKREDADDVCKKLRLLEKDERGQWQSKYLPPQINEGCIETPFFCADNATLFFSAMRADTYNGKDVPDEVYNIYYARRTSENEWVLPVYQHTLSTEHNDLSPTLPASGKYIFTNVKAKKIKRQPQKIYEYRIPDDRRPGKIFTLSGIITDATTKKPIAADILLQDAVTSFTKGNFTSNDEGRFSLLLTQGSLYRLDISKPNYSHVFINKDLVVIGSEASDDVDVAIFPTITLELNIYDNELFYPLSPRITITDSLTGKKVDASRITRVLTGKYRCRLDIGTIYTITAEADRFVPASTTFDLRGTVIYGEFENSMEMQASRREVKMNISSGDDGDMVEVEVRNLTRDETGVTLVMYDAVGNPVLSLREGDVYDINVWKKGYTYFNTTVDLSAEEPEKIEEAIKAIQEAPIVLQELTTETKMVFNNITFETNAAELSAASYEEVTRIVKFMVANPNIRIEISAHTDDKGSNAYNLRLSEKRAAYVTDYLESQGIDRSRMEAHGYGEERPIAPNVTDADRAANRRVEIKIIE